MSTIAHVVEATATGTLSMVAISANLMAQEGHVIHVVYSPRLETPDNFARLFHPTVVFHEVRMGGINAIIGLYSLRRLLMQIKPEVVHLHSSFAGFTGRVSTLGILPQARFFYSPHCISMMRTDIRYRKYAFAALERLAAVRNCTHLACSESERGAVRRWVGVDSIVLENAIDLDAAMAEAEVDRDELPFTVIAVGGIRPQKNPELFAEICEACRQSNVCARFVWVGHGDSGLVDRLRRAGVDVTGWKTRDQVAALLARSHIYLSTSSWEGMPVSVIEAMASGALVLATRCTGNVDVVEPNATGLLFDTVEEARDAIEAAVRDPAGTRAIRTRAKARALGRFSTKRYAAQLRGIYFPAPKPCELR